MADKIMFGLERLNNQNEHHNNRPPAPELPRSSSEDVEMCQESPWTRLPLELWLLVTDHGLCPIDRRHMTLTCRRLQTVFSHPSLWRVFVLRQTFQQMWQPELTEADRGMVRAFGRHFRSLLMPDWQECEKELERESLEALATLSLENQLAVMDIDLRCSDDHFEMSERSCLLAVIKLLHGAQHLSYLVVRNWPIYYTLLHDQYCLNFMLPQCADNTRRLIPRKLSRCFVNLHDFVLPKMEPHTQVAFFSNFAHIDSLTLRACYLDEETVEVLTSQRHLRLRELVVLVNDVTAGEWVEFEPIPESTWRRLKAAFAASLVDDVTPEEQEKLVDDDPILESTWQLLKADFTAQADFTAHCSPPTFCLAVVFQLTHLDAETVMFHLLRTSTMDRLTVTFLPNDVRDLEEGMNAMSRDSVAVFPSLRHIDLQLRSWRGAAPATLKPKLFDLQTALQRAFGPEARVTLTLPQG